MRTFLTLLAFVVSVVLVVAPANAQERGFLGVQLDERTEAGATVVVVIAVFPNTPAALAGLLPEDRVTHFADEAVSLRSDIVGRCASRPPGTSVSMVVLRGGETQTLEATLGVRPDPQQTAKAWLMGQPAPAWAARRVADDGAVASTDFTGKVVVLDFWAHWCGPCIAAIPDLNELATTFAGKDVAVVGITHEPRERSTEIAARMSYPSLYDAPGASDAAYFVAALPTLVVIDRAGVVREVRIGAGDLDEIAVLVRKLLAE